jgi:hypothetical protein
LGFIIESFLGFALGVKFAQQLQVLVGVAGWPRVCLPDIGI